MHFRIRSVVVSLVLCTAFSGFADNPIVQTYFTADPAPMVYKDTVFLYTSHDDDVTVNNFFTMNDWKLYSSVDMVNWTDHGTVASGKTFSWFNDNAWAPQTVERNGKFYMYCPVNNNSGARIGVLVADKPYGPFRDPVGREIAQSGSMAIDPTAFVDDDGQAYLFWGNGNLRMVKLNSDMISTTGNVTSNIQMQNFMEGPWFYKRGSLYYMVYAAGSGGGANEKISYATSSSPNGPWTYKGDIFNPTNINTNHAGVIDYKGRSYCFYHTGALSNNNGFKRSVCVEEFTYGSDGSIPKLNMSTNGPKQVDTLNPYDTVQAETICYSSGLKTGTCSEGGIEVNNIDNNDYIKVKGVGFGDGATKFEARVTPNSGSGKIELRLGSQSGTLIGTCTIDGSGSAWTTKSCTVSGATGVQDLFLKFTGSGSNLFKFNWWKFESATGVGSSAKSNNQKSSRLLVSQKDAGTITFSLQSPEIVQGNSITLTISDLQGRTVTTVSSNAQISGKEAFSINKNSIRSGMYMIRASSDGKVLYNNSYKL
ncbi:MAG: family 43 glycosylhydrolase [Fibrobacter sp.]|nr:family 43 glycosylhydrolase [Fibrobacter sp.]